MYEKKKEEEIKMKKKLEERIEFEKKIRLKANNNISKVHEIKSKEKLNDEKIALIFDSKLYKEVFKKYKDEIEIIYRFYIHIKDDTIEQPHYMEHMQYRVK